MDRRLGGGAGGVVGVVGGVIGAGRGDGTSDDAVWWGASRETFGTSTDMFNVTGTYTPLGGDFNGDGYGDVLWWAPGTTSDEVWFWFGRYSGGHDTVTATVDTPSTYTPFTGDFDGDGYSDIYWFKPGSGTDWIWFGDDDANEDDHVYDQDNEDYSSQARPAAGDFDGDGSDEIFWYGPGSNPDVLWDFSSRTSHTSSSVTVGGSVYQPSAGDFNGDGTDDLLLNNPTVAGGDAVRWGPNVATNSDVTNVSLAVDQLAVIGDFDGDGRDDLLANQTAAGGDTVWWGVEHKADFSASPNTGFALNPTTLDATYTYDVDGLRATKTVDGGTTQEFTWSTGTGLPMLLTLQSGSDTTYLVYGPGGQPIEQINPDNTALWLHHDQLGSVRATTKATDGTVRSTRRFDAYGTVANQTTTSSTDKQPLLGYAGQYTDGETGYQYLRARYYEPGTGQFLTVDPVVDATHEAYGYVRANPATESDPSGLCGPFGDGACPGSGLVETGTEKVKEVTCACAHLTSDNARGCEGEPTTPVKARAPDYISADYTAKGVDISVTITNRGHVYAGLGSGTPGASLCG